MKKLLVILAVSAMTVISMHAQRVEIPQGFEAVKAHFMSRINTLTIEIVNMQNGAQPCTGGTNCFVLPYSSENGEISKYIADLFPQMLETIRSGTPFFPSEYTLARSNCLGSNWRLDVRCEDRYLGRDSPACGSFINAPQQFTSAYYNDGSWFSADSLYHPEYFYGYENPYPYFGYASHVALRTDLVKWVEKRTETDLGEISTSATRNGLTGALGSSAKPSGLLGNGYIYLMAGTLSGWSVTNRLNDIRRKAPAGSLLPEWFRQTYRLWYDEAKTSCDEYAVTGYPDGSITYGWRQIGYTTSKLVLSPDGELNVAVSGLLTDTDYVIFPLMSVVQTSQTYDPVYWDVIRTNERGEITFTRSVDKSRESQFFVIRPYEGGDLSISTKP